MTRPFAVSLFALALYLGIWDCMVKLSFSAVHAWLVDSVGRTGVWIVIAATMLGGSWAVWTEQEDR